MSDSLVVRFEDASLAVVEKPSGIHTAPLRAGGRGTLLEAILARYPEVAAVPGIRPVEPGLLHRLDRETSGLVAVARTAAAFAALRKSFDRGGVHKEYLACCARAAGSGAGPSSAGEGAGENLAITSRFAPFGPGRTMVRLVLPGETRRSILRHATADSYSTEARVLRAGSGALLVAARIDRGFRHQVRAHLASLGLPILGDPLYGAPVPPGAAARMYLHAWRIELEHPVTGGRLVVESPLPPEFEALLEPAPAS